jgi:ribosomal protein L37E
VIRDDKTDETYSDDTFKGERRKMNSGILFASSAANGLGNDKWTSQGRLRRPASHAQIPWRSGKPSFPSREKGCVGAGIPRSFRIYKASQSEKAPQRGQDYTGRDMHTEIGHHEKNLVFPSAFPDGVPASVAL